MKVLVAGAGIAGSVLTHMLRDRGHEVLLADASPHRAASRCAYAYTRPDWFHGIDRARVRYALDWYGDRDWIISSTGWVTDVPRGRDFDQRGHYLIHPRGPLLIPDLPLELNRWFGPGGLVNLGDDFEVRVDRIVLATGASSVRWAPGTPVYGGVFECRDYRMSRPLKLLRITDRLTHVAADDGATTRTAASKGRTPEEAKAKSEKILETMLDKGIVTSTRRWDYRAGTRWNTDNGAPRADQVGANAWTLTGFARNGYALVPSYARDLVRRLEDR